MTNQRPSKQDTRGEAQRFGLIGLLVIQIFIGYEWFMSGLTKMIRGGFPSGLEDELREKSEGTVGWYRNLLDGTVIPNGKTFGVLIEVGELVIGIALIVVAIVWLARWSRLPQRGRVLILLATALASAIGIFMNVNFHLANGSAHPWFIPEDGFDEGVDLDSLLPLIQLVFLLVAGQLLRVIRRETRRAGESRGALAPTRSSGAGTGVAA